MTECSCRPCISPIIPLNSFLVGISHGLPQCPRMRPRPCWRRARSWVVGTHSCNQDNQHTRSLFISCTSIPSPPLSSSSSFFSSLQWHRGRVEMGLTRIPPEGLRWPSRALPWTGRAGPRWNPEWRAARRTCTLFFFLSLSSSPSPALLHTRKKIFRRELVWLLFVGWRWRCLREWQIGDLTLSDQKDCGFGDDWGSFSVGGLRGLKYTQTDKTKGGGGGLLD